MLRERESVAGWLDGELLGGEGERGVAFGEMYEECFAQSRLNGRSERRGLQKLKARFWKSVRNFVFAMVDLV